jgi:hypothetical protein
MTAMRNFLPGVVFGFPAEAVAAELLEVDVPDGAADCEHPMNAAKTMKLL